MVELLVGLALSLSLCVAIAPLWLSLETAGSRSSDRTIWLLQTRVAISRLERDLRLASGAGCLFPAGGIVLDASDSQVVFLGRGPSEDQSIIIEWEIARGSLMRRWGPCPAVRPVSYSHSLYIDNKTMLEGLGQRSSLAYVVDGAAPVTVVAAGALAGIDAVVLNLQHADAQSPASPDNDSAVLTNSAKVGR